ncbi:hypothetical protein VM98_37485, partial [Streptomyces rubellomurinus subsp. indigoferus]
PDLLRWHLPRTAPDGLLRPGLTVPLARYQGERPVALVVRTPRARADFGPRLGLAPWDGSANGGPPPLHPPPHPTRRFRLTPHRPPYPTPPTPATAAPSPPPAPTRTP